MAVDTVQKCIIHLIRNMFKLSSKKDWDAMKRAVKPIYTAPTVDAARAALDDLTEVWGKKYGAIIRLWSRRGKSPLRSCPTIPRSAR